MKVSLYMALYISIAFVLFVIILNSVRYLANKYPNEATALEKYPAIVFSVLDY